MHLFWPKVQVWWKFDQNRFGSFSASLGSIQRQQHAYKPIFLGLRSPETLTTRQGVFDDHTTFSISYIVLVRKWNGSSEMVGDAATTPAVRAALSCAVFIVLCVRWGGRRRWQLNVLPVSWSQCQGACVPSLLPARSAAPNQAPHSTFRNFSVAKRNRSPDNCRRGLRHRCGGFVLELVSLSVRAVDPLCRTTESRSGRRFGLALSSWGDVSTAPANAQ